MTLTDYFASQGELDLQPEVGDPNYKMFNSGGVECEVGEFLYGLVRMVKPSLIVETGTHEGVGAAYMAQGLKDNKQGNIDTTGHLDTIEWEMQHVNTARGLLTKLNLSTFVEIHYMKSEDFKPIRDIDILFLDTEPWLRFGELLKFYPHVREGGYILIHDLHANMNQIDNPEHGFGWPYGKLPLEIEALVAADKLRPIHFENPRGLTMFYKPSKETYRWHGYEKTTV